VAFGRGGKQPYAIARQDGAGPWESFRWPDETTVTRSFTILTTTPNAELAEPHDRMPVILERQDWPIWLGEADARTIRVGTQHGFPLQLQSPSVSRHAGKVKRPCSTCAALISIY
jgi:putative SOS response-associated peptidase YedK